MFLIKIFLVFVYIYHKFIIDLILSCYLLSALYLLIDYFPKIYIASYSILIYTPNFTIYAYNYKTNLYKNL